MWNIDDQLLKSHFMLMRAIKNEFDDKSTLTALTIQQLFVLVFLKEKGEPQLGELAVNFRITKPSATSMVDKLVRLKLARREEDKDDRRIIRVKLTPLGNQMLKKALEERAKVMKKFFTKLSEKDKLDLLRVFNRLYS